MATEEKAVFKEVGTIYLFIFIVWGLYRFLFRLPTLFEEVVLKGLVFGGSVAWLGYKNGWGWQTFGIRPEGLSRSVRWGLVAGMGVGLVGQLGNMIRHDGLTLSRFGLDGKVLGTFLILSLVTAFWEQLVFSGYILNRLRTVVADIWVRSWVVAVLFVLIHIPALILVSGLSGSILILTLILLLLMQMAAQILFYRFNNLAAPILAQALWGVTIYLFR